MSADAILLPKRSPHSPLAPACLLMSSSTTSGTPPFATCASQSSHFRLSIEGQALSMSMCALADSPGQHLRSEQGITAVRASRRRTAHLSKTALLADSQSPPASLSPAPSTWLVRRHMSHARCDGAHGLCTKCALTLSSALSTSSSAKVTCERVGLVDMSLKKVRICLQAEFHCCINRGEVVKGCISAVEVSTKSHLKKHCIHRRLMCSPHSSGQLAASFPSC